ncbi:MAG: serine hydrolase domain-containing protein [Cytophagales bacterium]|nr:serine hydrolase domain-containing protein [Cytophagales bacterium]
MKMLCWFGGLFFLAITSCSQSGPSHPIQSTQHLEASVDSLLNSYITSESPGAAVLIVHEGTPLLKKGYGLRNLETRQPITPATNMRMASVSKQFTALCALTLVEKGLISLDDPVTNYLPYPVFKGISIEQLMKHSSGLPDYYGHFDKNWPREKVVENADVLDWLKTNPEAEFEPGTKWEYSNTAYLMLAVIVEKVSGTEFSQYAKTQVFERLGMNRTMYYNLARPVDIPERSMCHGRTNGVYQGEDGFFMNGVMGDGAVYTNLEDYLRYDQVLRKDSILSKQVYDLIWKPGDVAVSDDVNYASGWFVDTKMEESSHSGGWVGTSTYVYRGLKNGITVAVFCNATNLLDPGKLAKQIRQMTECYLAEQ